MKLKSLVLFLLVTVVSTLLAFGQEIQPVWVGSQASALLTQPLNDAVLIRLHGNTRPEANTANDRGRVADKFLMPHMLLQLQRPAKQEQDLEQFLNQIHDPNSPNFHRWLTAREFGERFGLAPEDIRTISGWLQSHGFKLDAIYPNGTVISFSGTAGQVRRAFHTEIHRLEVNGEKHIANMSDPYIPAALAPAVAGVVSLNDFRPHPMNRPKTDFTVGDGLYLVVPADLATIYNLNPLFAAGYSGQGQTIVVVEDTDVYSTNDWATFRQTLGLSSYSSGSFTQIHPAGSGSNTCNDPGVNGDDGEAILDAEWASAAAPSAAIQLASCADTTVFGGHLALLNLLNGNSAPPAIVSISYGTSETALGAAYNNFVNQLHEQAVAEGVSVFVSSGDQAAAVSDRGAEVATHGINVNGFASTPYNVAVGGTDFGDTYENAASTYWGATNGATYGSARSYIPEIPWNDSCASQLIAHYLSGSSVTYGNSGFCNSYYGSYLLNVVGGSGGPSGCATGSPASSDVVGGSCAGYTKPSWQSVLGNPHDGVRDLPDVSLFAANGFWMHYYVVCYSDLNYGGSSCAGNPDTWAGFGGTSISSPIMAAMQALVNQATRARWGNPNPLYYAIAAAEYGSTGNAACNSSLGNAVASGCVFYDVIAGDMDAPCIGSVNCYLPSGEVGVLSTSNSAYQPAFAATT
ncbi:MAG TPA: protease pro-enzyme activation domain-containing protein, partial [Terriglobales bacterium]|nr:protease pro-enzyme activation domain-containing protein [Terriglobales bacterium]